MSLFLRATTPKVSRSLFGLLSFFLVFAAAVVAQTQYLQTNLVSDVPGMAQFLDPDLANPWGLAASATSPWWVADNGTGLSTLYNGSGTKQSLIVTVATGPADPDNQASPTGIVFNGTTDFDLTPGQPGTAARFIFVTDDGTISGWNPTVNPNHSVRKVNSPGSIYLGATLGQTGAGNFLYVANFHSGTIDVFDRNYMPVSFPAGAFVDTDLPADYGPFNVQNIGGNIYVAWAKQDDDHEEEVHGPKLGYVDEFDSSGNLLLRFAHGPWMNSPWGMAISPAAFGKAGGKLLVGMFGSGEIATFDPVTGEFTSLLRAPRGRPITIDGLWALRFGNGGNAGSPNTLFFTAGIDDEQHGLFGTITPIPNGRGGGGGVDVGGDVK